MAEVPQGTTLSDFLVWEAGQPVRHEFHCGRVRPVDDGRRLHGRVVGNLAAALGNGLDGSPCQVFCTSMPVQVVSEAVLYPDVLVTCGRADLAADAVFRAPTLVMEVPAPGSMAWDWSEKFALYRRISALCEYVLIDPDTRRVESFRRTADGGWTFHDMSADATMALPSIDCGVTLAEVFQGLDAA